MSQGLEAPGVARMKMVLTGIGAGAGLVSLYLTIVTLAQDAAHAFQQLREDLWFVAPIALGLGAQVALYGELRRLHRASRGHATLTAASAGVSGTAMLACCAHHLTDVLPVLGLSGAAIFLNELKTPLAFVGLATTAAGVAYMGRHVGRMRRALGRAGAVSASPIPDAKAGAAACHPSV